jgi:ferredoxin--NADP+ reductase
MVLANAMPGPTVADAARLPALPARRSVGFEPNATLVERQDLTPSILRLRVRADDGVPDFQAGQYFAIGLQVDGRLVQRPYSTASAPGEPGDLEFLVRLVHAGSLTPSLWRLRPGDRVRIGPPKGLFTLEAGDLRRHLFLSTGTGIAPFMSMLATLLGGGRPGGAGRAAGDPPIVVHGVAAMTELAYRERLEGLARDDLIVYVPAVSRPTDAANTGWRGKAGRLDAVIEAIAEQTSLAPTATVAYLCGNPAMIAAVEPRLATLGLPADAIRVEQYWTPRDAGPKESMA